MPGHRVKEVKGKARSGQSKGGEAKVVGRVVTCTILASRETCISIV